MINKKFITLNLKRLVFESPKSCLTKELRNSEAMIVQKVFNEKT